MSRRIRIVVELDERDLADATELRQPKGETVQGRQAEARKRVLNAIYDAWRRPPAAPPVTAADFAPAPTGADRRPHPDDNLF